MKQPRIACAILSFALLATGLAVPALAQEGETGRSALVSPGQWHVGVYGGLYDPRGPFDEDAVYGVRLGRQVGDRAFFEGNVGYWESDAELDVPNGRVRIDIKTYVFEGRVGAIYRTRSRINPVIYGGIGFHTGEVDNSVVQVTGLEDPVFPETVDEGLTLHIGTGLKFQLDHRIYIRTDVLLRWYEAREGDDIDKELTLGMGIKF